MVTIDTLRADHLGCYGYSKIATPNLDRLAGQGVLFENAVAPDAFNPAVSRQHVHGNQSKCSSGTGHGWICLGRFYT